MDIKILQGKWHKVVALLTMYFIYAIPINTREKHIKNLWKEGKGKGKFETLFRRVNFEQENFCNPKTNRWCVLMLNRTIKRTSKNSFWR